MSIYWVLLEYITTQMSPYADSYFELLNKYLKINILYSRQMETLNKKVRQPNCGLGIEAK